MSEEFFERLGERARHIIYGEVASYPNEHVFNAGINATIEALKEMMVGEPIRAQGGPQSGDSAGQYTMIIIPRKTSIRSSDSFALPGHHGLAGKDLVVIVFKDAQEA